MKVEEKTQARALRREGRSIRTIARALGVAKSSVSVWVADIELTEEQILVLKANSNRNRVNLLGQAERLKAAAAQRHAQYRREGWAWAERDERFRLICALYWGEGTKTLRQRSFAISNSDPCLLRVVLAWLLDSGYGDRVTFCVQYYPGNGLTEEAITAWWLEQLPGLQRAHLRAFTRQVVNRASQRKKVGRLPNGTALLRVYRTDLFFQIMGGIDYLATLGT
jgi:hypothetical protein